MRQVHYVISVFFFKIFYEITKKKLSKGLSQGNRRYFLNTFLNFHQFLQHRPRMEPENRRKQMQYSLMKEVNANGIKKLTKKKHFC